MMAGDILVSDNTALSLADAHGDEAPRFLQEAGADQHIVTAASERNGNGLFRACEAGHGMGKRGHQGGVPS
jgi:hypothetical protein